MFFLLYHNIVHNYFTLSISDVSHQSPMADVIKEGKIYVLVNDDWWWIYDLCDLITIVFKAPVKVSI